jgi:CDP-glucose 4,6-dehydratase
MENGKYRIVKMQKIDPTFWRGKKVFLTGHTGFKGGWLSLWLNNLGAFVTGYSLSPSTNPSFYEIGNIKSAIEKSYIADVRNLEELHLAMKSASPDIVIHMAAQPLVRLSYENPVETYSTNVMGTVNVLDCVRRLGSIRAVVIVTSDKCYENREWVWGYRENEPMGGYDPYSNSKGCAELVAACFRNSYFSGRDNSLSNISVATARAGNVIGGGDWSLDRLIPDAWRAFESGRPITIRNPNAVRPWQHVLEPLGGYIALTQALYESGPKFVGAWNFGPKNEDSCKVKDVIEMLISKSNSAVGWLPDDKSQPHEARSLKLDCSKANHELEWTPKLRLENAIQLVVDWQRSFKAGADMQKFSLNQIREYEALQCR